MTDCCYGGPKLLKSLGGLCLAFGHYVMQRVVVQVKESTDTSHFDDHPPDKDDTPDDTTGWDSEF